jgi:uncharacterized membrane protein YdjX (TVP38/TMEM64 family)
MTKRSLRLILASAAIVAALAILFIVPATREGVFTSVRIIASLDIEALKAYILSFGPWAAVVSFALMVLQSLAAPLPAFLITFANAALFGWVRGAILSWTSAMAGASLCFGIARLYGREVVVKFTGTKAIQATDQFFEKYGTNSVLIARLLPFMPFDIVSYAAGLTPMKFWPFFLATGIGQLPATIVYSWSGSMLTGGLKAVLYGLTALFVLAALTWSLKKWFTDRKKRKSATTAAYAAKKEGPHA